MARQNSLLRLKDRIVRFLLYSNIWIGLAAVAMVLQTEYLWYGSLEWSAYHAFVFFATLFTYAAHRLFALSKLEKDNWQERFYHIAQAQRAILVYAIISGLATLILFLFFQIKQQGLLVIPGIISLAYIFPVLKGGKRVRDIHFIKIFLIALVWAWITVVLPLSGDLLVLESEIIALYWERALFIFAITLPFDVRDLLLDADQEVKTLPALIGIKGTRLAASIALALGFLLASFNLAKMVYSPLEWGAIALSFLISYYLVYHAHEKQPDYYFTGYLDGTMILQFILVFLAGQA